MTKEEFIKLIEEIKDKLTVCITSDSEFDEMIDFLNVMKDDILNKGE